MAANCLGRLRSFLLLGVSENGSDIQLSDIAQLVYHLLKQGNSVWESFQSLSPMFPEEKINEVVGSIYWIYMKFLLTAITCPTGIAINSVGTQECSAPGG